MQHCRHRKQFPIVSEAFLLILILLTSCQSTVVVQPSPHPSTATRSAIPSVLATVIPSPTEVLPTQTEVVTASTADPSIAATVTSMPTPAALATVKEENGWVTYRNEIVGYEISAPKRYTIKGGGGISGAYGDHLLGPAVPNEEIYSLISKYYGDSLNVYIVGTDPTSQSEALYIGIYAYDIIVKNLGGNVSPGGIGDYQLTSRQDTLQIDMRSYPVMFTVENRDKQPVGELAVLYLEKDGVEFMFGYIQPKDDPQAYQIYLKEIWPEIRKIVETYKKIPEKTSLSGIPSVNASDLKDASPQGIAQALFEQYLAPFEDNPFDPLMKLSAYRIDDVEIPDKWQACADRNKAEFIATITYSVKPEHWPPERWTEDGYLTFDHWITRKKSSIAVFHSGQDYTMQVLDNPICPGS